MENNQKIVEKYGKAAENCMILYDGKTIGIYMFGFHGNFSNHRFFVHGDEKLPCRLCRNRAKHILKECSVDGFCLGFKPIPHKDSLSFNLGSLMELLKKEGYSIRENYRNGYLCYPNQKDKPLVTVHLIDIP